MARQLLQAAGPNDQELKASVLRELGVYELSLGQLGQAADHLDAALAHSGGDEFVLCALVPRITVALEQNELDSARLYLGRAEAIIARSANRLYRTAWLRHAAMLEHRSGKLEPAIEINDDVARCGGLYLLRGHLAFADVGRAGALRHFVAAVEQSAAGMWRALACLDGAWLC